MRKIFYSRPDGELSIVSVPVDTDAAIAAALAKLPATASNVTTVDESVVPLDRTFRNAWRQNGVSVRVDLPIARTLVEKEIETRRRVKIRDVLEREALGENVAVEKAALRSINARLLVDAAQTPEALKAVIPEVLK